ncbi:uncharacterized protein LOC116614356 [Nematostella vectensis]|uniref:uncharacterized protein LOC116614356 n=1 Tax=Nematostella vectensis TaxID=45351 RepID=UPI002077026B|nr:uncharacterized protein LOC116614356 [Nematostella vectensis]
MIMIMLMMKSLLTKKAIDDHGVAAMISIGDTDDKMVTAKMLDTNISTINTAVIRTSHSHVISHFSEGSLIEALSNFEIRVGMSAEFKTNPMCGARVISTHVGELWTSQCTPPLPGQYVSVQMYGNVYLSLCEVAVFARKDNHGKCSDELRRKRSLITSYKDLVLKRATVTYGRYE